MIQALDPAGAQTVLTAMAAPAMLLLANAMLILSTNQRLQAILQRIWETEETSRREQDDPVCLGAVLAELESHARRARLSHRALLALYAAAAAFLVMVGSIGTAALGFTLARPLALGAAFAGAALLLTGAALLSLETWIGIGAIDGRVARIVGRHAEDPRGR
ncbi:MAG: DUF2721 domain-containing protein [Gemmatimonadota bacterium]|nr:DUF2721 domain-containing protein [Gemmatimonadota bacterium]